MQISCPHCRNHIEIVEPDADVGSVTHCPLCGSELAQAIETRSFQPADKAKRQLDSRFELLERLGRGHYGEVWRATDHQLQRTVALKVPRSGHTDPYHLTLFSREARAAAQLNHPQIVKVHDVVVAEDHVFIVSEFIQGVTLAEYLRHQKLTTDRAAELCAQVAGALEHAHQSGVIHRDLKPSNILLDGDQSPRLTDFGLAKWDGDEFSIAVDGEILGTPAYMSPEQAAGKASTADRRSDVYSLGVILYELLSGRRPFLGESRLLVHQILHQDPPPLYRRVPAVPKDLETICLKALEKDPSRRYQTAGEMAEDLRHFLRREPINARPISRFARGSRWLLRNPAWAAVIGVSVAATLIAGGLATQYVGALASLSAMSKLVPAAQLPVEISIASEPAGADFTFYPIDELSGRIQYERGQTERGSQRIRASLLPGPYLVVAVLPNGDFHEVFRHVPLKLGEPTLVEPHHRADLSANGVVEWMPVRIRKTEEVIDGMAFIQGTESYSFGSDSPQQSVFVPDFYLDPTEVTRSQFEQVFQGSPVLTINPHPEDFPITQITLDDALAYAEAVGKVIPDEILFEYATTNRGTTSFPWGEDSSLIEGWELARVGTPEFDRLPTAPPVFGLYSNALEWTCSLAAPNRILPGHPPIWFEHTVVRGGPQWLLVGKQLAPSDAADVRIRFSRRMHEMHDMLSFRCARWKQPRTALVAKLSRVK